MMRTYRGIVCEKKTKYMVFLTEKGEFLRGVPIGDPPDIGEEAEFTIVTPSFIAGRKAKTRFAGAVLVAAALLFFFVSSLSPLNNKVMAYVQLQAGTAMEFGVNRKGNVISLRYLNEMSDETGRLSEWKNHPLLAVLDMAVLELSTSDRKVTITTIYPTSESDRETRQMVGDAVQNVRVKHGKLNLDIAESTPAERKVANKKNMSIQQFKATEQKHPATKKDPATEKPAQPQKDALQKQKKDAESPASRQQKEKEQPNKSQGHQNPPVEKTEKKSNDNRNEKVPPHAEKKGPPDHSSSIDKQNNGNHGSPANKQKENPANEKKNAHNK